MIEQGLQVCLKPDGCCVKDFRGIIFFLPLGFSKIINILAYIDALLFSLLFHLKITTYPTTSQPYKSPRTHFAKCPGTDT